MFTKTLAIIWKDTVNRFSSRSELLFFIILPVIFTAILGGGVNFTGDGDDRVTLPVVDLDGSEGSAALLAELTQSETVRPELMTLPEAEAMAEDGDIAGMLLIASGFGEAASPQGLIRGTPAALTLRLDSGNNYSLVIEQAVLAAVSELSAPLQVASGALHGAEAFVPLASDEARIAFLRDSQSLAGVRLATSSAAAYVAFAVTGSGDDFEYEAAGQASAGQLITWVLIPLLATSALFAYERATGTLRRLLVTPTRGATYLFGTLSGQLLLGLVQMGLLIGFGALVMGVNWGKSPVALLLILVTFGLAGVAMGTMLGTFTKTDSQAGNLSIMLGMVMALLGGCWWPIELFPEGVRAAVHVLPTTWAMQGLTDITMRGQGVDGVLLEAGVLLAFAAGFFVIGILRFRYE